MFTIVELESIERNSLPGRRGRKSMGVAERRLVSKRMKQYWADWRQKGRSDHEIAPA
jgi:hypothetical protein